MEDLGLKYLLEDEYFPSSGYDEGKNMSFNF